MHNNEVLSKVILLTNMVGPGEVDDILQEETADECSKYGKVERCLIFEVKIILEWLGMQCTL